VVRISCFSSNLLQFPLLLFSFCLRFYFSRFRLRFCCYFSDTLFSQNCSIPFLFFTFLLTLLLLLFVMFYFPKTCSIPLLLFSFCLRFYFSRFRLRFCCYFCDILFLQNCSIPFLFFTFRFTLSLLFFLVLFSQICCLFFVFAKTFSSVIQFQLVLFFSVLIPKICLKFSCPFFSFRNCFRVLKIKISG